tara:strand:+ start:2920 stop:3123 length:204 start_codon:yes stop_codon:yes gene_type:complete
LSFFKKKDHHITVISFDGPSVDLTFGAKLKKIFGKTSQVGTNLGTIFLSYNLHRFRAIWIFGTSKKA